MHSLKICHSPHPLRVAPPSLFAISDCGFLPPPAAPILVLQPRSPLQPPHPALSRCHRSFLTLRAVIVVLVLWLVWETFSGLLLG